MDEENLHRLCGRKKISLNFENARTNHFHRRNLVLVHHSITVAPTKNNPKMMHASIPRPYLRTTSRSSRNQNTFVRAESTSTKSNNQEEANEEDVTLGAKTRSLSICPSTFIASEEWRDFQAKVKKTRAKSMFVGEVGATDGEEFPILSPVFPDHHPTLSEKDEDKNVCRSPSMGQRYSMKERLLEQGKSNRLQIEIPGSTSKSSICNKQAVTSASGKLTVYESPCPRSVADLRISFDSSDFSSSQDEEAVVIPMKHLMNYNRDRTGIHISRAAQFRRDHPDTPTSPTDKRSNYGDVSPRAIFHCPS